MAYPKWVGLGAVGTFVLGITVLGESLDPAKVVGLVAIIGGVAAPHGSE